MREIIVIWLPVWGGILVGTCLLPPVAIGVIRSYGHVFGRCIQDDVLIGRLLRSLVFVGGFSILTGLLWLPLLSLGKIDEMHLIVATGVGGGFGLFVYFEIVETLRTIRNREKWCLPHWVSAGIGNGLIGGVVGSWQQKAR